MTNSPFPLPAHDASEEDTQPMVYTPPVDTLALLTVDVPRSFSSIAAQLEKDTDADFWLNDPPLPDAPLPFEPITMRYKVARGLRQIAFLLERGVK